MAALDRTFKELLKAFFPEFLQLFYPDIAEALDFSTLRFLDKEVFTDLPVGELREADLVAEIKTRSGEVELVLVHTEIESRRRPSVFPRRMWQYYALLRLRYSTPIVPIVLYLSGGAGGVVVEEYTESVFGRRFLLFQYLAIGLPDLQASDYEERANPLGPALSALMRSTERNRAVRWAKIVRQEARLGIDPARLALVIDLLDRRLTLTPEEETTLATLTKTEEFQETDLPLTGFLRRAVIEGRTEGRQLGRAEGRAEAKRETLVELVRLRFGTLTEEQAERLSALSEEAHLDRLLKALLSAESVDALLGQS